MDLCFPMNYTVDLRCGQLRLSVLETDYPLESLCEFGCRRSKRRGFVIVSKVLGKHIPVRPHQMHAVHVRLASKIGDVPSPVLFIALAETAIGLGQAVFEHWVRQTSRADAVFLHSTRYRLSQPLAFAFSEPHSHAPDHLVYLPAEPKARSIFQSARSLILIDDEITTGKTLMNLARKCTQVNPNIQSVVFVCLTCWNGNQCAQFEQDLCMPVVVRSLLNGTLEFVPNPSFHAPAAPDVNMRHDVKDTLLLKNFGRLGTTAPITYDFSKIVTQSVTAKPARILVIGTGEFTHLPFRLAQRLETLGHDVFFQSTTRSPLLPGESIQDVLEFEDNYGDQMPNYLYNARQQPFDRVFIGYETPYWPSSHTLPKALNAQTFIF
jgi:hypothetical protein